MTMRGWMMALPLLAVGGGPALAQDGGLAGTLEARLRAVVVAPDSSATITAGGAAVGGKTSVTDSVIPEFDLTYFLTDNISANLIAGVTRHTVGNSVTGRIASVSLLPPTVTVLYHFDPNGAIRPYLGGGLNYTIFYDPTPVAALKPISFSDNVGFALQGGADIPVGNGPYFLNFDVKKLFLNTGVTAAGGAVRAKAHLDPWLIGFGVGVRF
jgi:outer membrane protein